MGKGGTSMSKIQSTDSARSWFCVLNTPQSLFDKEMNPEQIVDVLISRWMNQNPRNTCAVNYEIGDTGNHHCHMVLCNENKIRFSTIQNTFPGIHIEPTKGSKADVESYIKKLGKFEEKAHTIVVPAKFSGVILGADNNKNMNQIYDDITVMLNAGMSPEQIMSTGLKYRKQETLIRKAYMAKRHQETPLRRQVDVYYHVGESGDGKSYTYVKLCDEYGKENVYLMTDYKNTGTGGIDYYQGERILFMDEYKGELTYSQFLVMTDQYPAQIHCRYANVYALWNEIHITSVYPPEEVYERMVNNEDRLIDTQKQLVRRLKSIIYHYKENGEYKTFEMPSSQYVNYNDLKKRALKAKDCFYPVEQDGQMEMPF